MCSDDVDERGDLRRTFEHRIWEFVQPAIAAGGSDRAADAGGVLEDRSLDNSSRLNSLRRTDGAKRSLGKYETYSLVAPATVVAHLERSAKRMTTPKELVKEWIRRFNAADADGLAALYALDAVNHQVVMAPLRGRAAIHEMLRTEFARAKMVCIEENLLESGEWAVLEWSDPLGLRGCGFFHVKNGQIVFQRGYFDQLTFFRTQDLRVPESYLGQE